MKNPTHYFVCQGHGIQTKNKLQEEFKSYLKSLDATLVDADKLSLLTDKIIKKANELNQKYSRCVALKITFSDKYNTNGLMIDGFNYSNFQILKAYHDSN